AGAFTGKSTRCRAFNPSTTSTMGRTMQKKKIAHSTRFIAPSSCYKHVLKVEIPYIMKNQWSCVRQTVDPIQNSAVPWQHGPRIFDPQISLQTADRRVSYEPCKRNQ